MDSNMIQKKQSSLAQSVIALFLMLSFFFSCFYLLFYFCLVDVDAQWGINLQARWTLGL